MMLNKSSFQLVICCVFAFIASSTAAAASLFEVVDPYDWLNQCVPPFQEANFAETQFIPSSNYFLIDQPAGLCADFLACAFERCVLPPKGIAVLNSTDASQVASSSNFLETSADLPPLNLPAHIAFPENAKDVVDLVEIAKENCWTISIKNGGHSHHGASTMKDSLQLNLRYLQGYANSSTTTATTSNMTSTGIVQCSSISNETAHPASQACRRATANGNTAVVRVGGGEVWDYVYRAVLAWNEDQTDDADKYDIVGGGAGSVSSIGGWMQGGGLSIGDERMYGFGVDQVMELQMVLANGMHVKFGPTDWERDATNSSLYPLTTKVEGFCNWNVTEDELEWDWKDCPMDIPFDKLWKAVRGGGGGTYGIVTSAYYQLHPYKPLYRVFPDLAAGPAFLGACAQTPGCIETVSPVLSIFFINLLYDPEVIGLDVETSNSCGSPSLAFDISWALRGVNSQLFCRNPEPVVAAWQAYLSNSSAFQSLGAELATLGRGIFSVTNVGSYALAGSSHDGSRVPLGRIIDEHPPATNYITENCWAILVPTDFFLLKSPDALSLLSAIIPAHVIGGNAAISSDTMTAVPDAERRAGFQGFLCTDLVGAATEEAAWKAWKLFHPPGLDEGDFYGGSEYNHIDNIWFGPLKADFTTPCPANYTIEEKEEDCVSVEETVWGTKLLAELEDIKKEVDPDNMFRCYRCVGATNPRVCGETNEGPGEQDSGCFAFGAKPLYYALVFFFFFLGGLGALV